MHRTPRSTAGRGGARTRLVRQGARLQASMINPLPTHLRAAARRSATRKSEAKGENNFEDPPKHAWGHAPLHREEARPWARRVQRAVRSMQQVPWRSCGCVGAAENAQRPRRPPQRSPARRAARHAARHDTGARSDRVGIALRGLIGTGGSVVATPTRLPE